MLKILCVCGCGLGSVSYTHLDVYKRQRIDILTVHFQRANTLGHHLSLIHILTKENES